MIYFYLVYEFFKIGLFSFGGGYATIPFLYQLSVQYGWYSIKELSQMVAVASITPGPVGINVATYAGLKTAGIFGSFCATVFEMLPSLIFVIIVSKLLRKFHENYIVKSLISTLKPIGAALLLYVSVGLLKPILGDIKGLMLLLILLLLSFKSKKTPLFYMLISAMVGIILCFFPS